MTVARSAWEVLRAHLGRRAAAHGIEIVDLHPAFLDAFRRDGRRLEFAGDFH